MNDVAVQRAPGRLAPLHAAPIALFVLGLFYFWFGIADRYAIFLYNHLGATPFDSVTRGRYWMAGLVASGMVMVFYTIGNWVWGRIARLRHRTYQPPAWWRVWLWVAPPLLVGIPLITMTQNQPTLPWFLALQCTAATLGGLALALVPGSLAAGKPSALVWSTLYGIGVTAELLLLRVLELPGRGLVSPSTAAWVALGSVLGGSSWLLLMVWLRRRRQLPALGAQTILVAGVSLSYVILPLVHYLFFVPPAYRYISTATNFFAFSPEVQLLTVGVAALMALGAAWVPEKLLGR
jgi:hypothetical protein